MTPDLVEIIRLTLQVSGTALLISMLFGIPAGIFLGLRRFGGILLGITFLVNLVMVRLQGRLRDD